MRNNRPDESAKERAQDLVYQAMESYDPEEAIRLCEKAVQLDPRCVDALTMLAGVLKPEERVEALKQAIEIAEEDLGGESFFEENKGYFWGILETRPYMRARAGFAQSLYEAGRIQEAIAEYKALLELNPGDNQGIRYLLIGLLLEAGDMEGVRDLLDEYDERSAVFAWSEVLERLLSGDPYGAEQFLTIARVINLHVEKYLLGRKPMPVMLPDYYSHGDESEAVMCVDTIGAAWKKHPEAVRWLRQRELPVETVKKPKVGRNEPCPCGSGKKYKKCCLDKDEAPSGPAPSLVEGEMMLKELHQVMEGKVFESEEEVDAFLQEFSRQKSEEQQSAAPVDFEGLSGEQLERMLRHTFEAPELVEFPDVLSTTPSAPISTLFAMLADAIGEKGLKPTATGNLPRKTTQDIALAYWGEEEYKDNTRFGDIRTEPDFFDLHITRIVAEQAGLIRKYGGKFVLTNKCRKLMKEGGLSAVYPLLLRAYTRKYSWAYGDGYPDMPTMQNTWPYTLYLLERYGDQWHENTFYEDKFLWAFPTIVEEVEIRFTRDPEDKIRHMYSLRCLRRFAAFLGLVEIEDKSDFIFDRVFKLEKTPLLGDAVRFQKVRGS